MRNDNVVLIQRILAGDAIAFERLVGKYQKQVHTLAWRKVRDFHIAEDITQETFLQVYQMPGGKFGISISLKILRRKPSCKSIRNWKPWRIRRGFQGGFM